MRIIEAYGGRHAVCIWLLQLASEAERDEEAGGTWFLIYLCQAGLPRRMVK